MITAVVPLKSFWHAKSRLSGRLSPDERAALAEAMAADVLNALQSIDQASRPLVVTEDAEVAAFAQSCGADVLMEPSRRGYNAAVAKAALAVSETGTDAMLVLPGDLPAITKADIEALIEAHGDRPGLTLCSDRAGTGTNALLVSPPNAMSFAFGPGSFRWHEMTGHMSRLTVRTLKLPGIAFDIDSYTDFTALADTPVGQNTSQFLELYALDAQARSQGFVQHPRTSAVGMAE